MTLVGSRLWIHQMILFVVSRSLNFLRYRHYRSVTILEYLAEIKYKCDSFNTGSKRWVDTVAVCTDRSSSWKGEFLRWHLPGTYITNKVIGCVWCGRYTKIFTCYQFLVSHHPQAWHDQLSLWLRESQVVRKHFCLGLGCVCLLLCCK